LRELKKRDLCVLRVPYTIEFEELKRLDVQGVLISNGPGDPSVLVKTIDLVRQILLHCLPVAGICLGHQLLALAIGGKTYKMKFGHRGVNHPVKDLERNKVLITTHNHGFAVQPSSLRISGMEDDVFHYEKFSNTDELMGESPAGFGKVKITHVSLNDGTIEGMKLLDYPAFSVQFHPEACPGPHDANFFFDDFTKLIKGR
jgi:carbamoyl-phosphate synthase small subunit